MRPTPRTPEEVRERTARLVSYPDLWPLWPFLPVVRRRGEGKEMGLLYDALHARGLPGYSCTVFRCNVFRLPPTVEDLLALPKEVFDTVEELIAAGWTVD